MYYLCSTSYTAYVLLDQECLSTTSTALKDDSKHTQPLHRDQILISTVVQYILMLAFKVITQASMCIMVV